MSHSTSDFEVCFKGQTFLTVDQGQLNVQGVDFQTDLVNISRLINILSDVMNAALTAQVEAGQPCPKPVKTSAQQLIAAHSGNVYPLHATQRN